MCLDFRRVDLFPDYKTADDDIWRILSENVPKEHHLHIHCFTDSPELAQKLFDHFPNCWIGITGK